MDIFGFREFLKLRWDSFADGEERKEFIMNFNRVSQQTNVGDRIYDLSEAALARIFRLPNQGQRVDHATSRWCPEFQQGALVKNAYKLTACSDVWKFRFFVFNPIFGFRGVQKDVPKGYAIWFTAHAGPKDAAHEFSRNFWKELARVQESTAHDERTTRTSIAAHIALIMATTESQKTSSVAESALGSGESKEQETLVYRLERMGAQMQLLTEEARILARKP